MAIVSRLNMLGGKAKHDRLVEDAGQTMARRCVRVSDSRGTITRRREGAGAELQRSYRSGDRSALQPETYSHLHLKFGFRISHGTPNLPDLEPINVAQRLARLVDGLTDRLMNTLVRHANDFDNLVGFLGHDSLLVGALTRPSMIADS